MVIKNAGPKVIANIKNKIEMKTNSFFIHLLELFVRKAMETIYMRLLN